MKNTRWLLLVIGPVLGVSGLVWLVAGGRGDDPRPGQGPGGGVVPATGTAIPFTASGGATDVQPSMASAARSLEQAIFRVKKRGERDLNASSQELIALAQSEEGLLAILEALRGEPEPNVGSLLLMALAATSELAAAVAIRDAANGEFGEDLRATGILILGESGAKENTRILANVLNSEEDQDLITAALAALSIQNTSQAHRALAEFLSVTGDPRRRMLIWVAIMGRPLPVSDDETFVRRDLRRSHLCVLNEMPLIDESREAVEIIIRYARAERDPGCRMMAAMAMLRMPGTTTVEPFFEMWETLEAPARMLLVGEARADLSAAKIPGLLRQVGQDPDRESRFHLANRSRELCTTQELPALEEWRDHEADPEIKGLLKESIAAIRSMNEPR